MAPSEPPKAPQERPTSRKLSHLYHIAFTIPELTKSDILAEGDKVIEITTPFVDACNSAGVVPFWQVDCPQEFAAKWGSDWSRIHSAMGRLASLQGKEKIAHFNWINAGLGAVLDCSRKEEWGSCFDAPVSHSMILRCSVHDVPR